MSSKRSLVTGTLWTVCGQFATITITFITNVFLTRYLTPVEFGRVGIIMFFITICNVLSEGGLAGALVRKEELKAEDYTTVFIFNVIISFVLYFILFLLSGLVSKFYNDITLESLIKAGSLIIVVNSAFTVQNAKVYREMKFKLNLYVNLISIIVGSLVGIYLAVTGYGVWAIIYMYLAISFLKAVILWRVLGGIGRLRFSYGSFQGLYKYGFYTMLSSIVSNFFDNLYQLIFAKNFSVVLTGFYYQGKKLQTVPFSILNTLSLGVIFSYLSKQQKDRELFQERYLEVLSVFSIFSGAIASLSFLLAEDVILLLFGRQWSGATIFVQILSISSFFQAHKVFCQNILKIYNRADQIFKWELLGQIFQLVSIFCGILFKNYFLLLSGIVFSNIFSLIFSSIFSWQYLRRSFTFELTLILKVVFASGLSILASSLSRQADTNITFNIVGMFLSFFITYIILLWFMNVYRYSNMFSLYKAVVTK